MYSLLLLWLIFPFLWLQRYAVIPLSTNSGLIGWVPFCDTLHTLIRDYREKKKILLNIEHRIMLRVIVHFLLSNQNLTLNACINGHSLSQFLRAEWILRHKRFKIISWDIAQDDVPFRYLQNVLWAYIVPFLLLWDTAQIICNIF